MKPMAHWMPTAFCVFLCLLALSLQIGSASDAWKPAFYCFLPMCFVFGGMVTSRMHRELRELQRQLDELRRGAAK